MTRKNKSAIVPVLPRLRVKCSASTTLGPGRVELLELVEKTGSLRAAASEMGMAYMTAWKHMKTLNRAFRGPVIVSKRGGRAGGGAELTNVGRQVVTLYHRMEKDSHAAIQKGFQQFQTLVKR